jgi:O-antigen/teichoic acid export membrane protein
MSHTRKILQGSASNVARVVLSTMIALVLPPLLVHRLEPVEYGAWVLILQCSTYISLLDFGMQTAVAKFVAQHDALEDRAASSRVLSSSFAILCICALFGAVVILLIVWRVPQLFRQMPLYLIGDVRIGILVLGLSTVIALPFGAFLAVFTGLQRYGFPTVLSMLSKILSSTVLAVLLLMHGRLPQLVWVLAAFNLATALGQFVGWKTYASDRVGFALRLADRETAVQLAKYGGILSIWMIAGLLISGLDVLIVGRFDYGSTGYYGLASSATNFMLLIVGGLIGPLLPAISSLQAQQTHGQIGQLTIKSTRYCALLLCLTGLPLAFGSYPLLKLWVGQSYAARSVVFLQVLILGNAIRQLASPYSLAVIATGKQHLATIAAIAEAVVNLCVSLYLVQRIGAVGVAIGTVVGACVSVGLHLTVSMKYTQSAIAFSRRHFVVQGLLRPMLCIVPSLLLLPAWNRFAMLPWSVPLLAFWVAATLLIVWRVGLTQADRDRISAALLKLSRPRYAEAP